MEEHRKGAARLYQGKWMDGRRTKEKGRGYKKLRRCACAHCVDAGSYVVVELKHGALLPKGCSFWLGLLYHRPMGSCQACSKKAPCSKRAHSYMSTLMRAHRGLHLCPRARQSRAKRARGSEQQQAARCTQQNKEAHERCRCEPTRQLCKLHHCAGAYVAGDTAN